MNICCLCSFFLYISPFKPNYSFDLIWYFFFFFNYQCYFLHDPAKYVLVLSDNGKYFDLICICVESLTIL